MDYSRRYTTYLNSGSKDPYTLWLTPLLCEWAIENGFQKDPTLIKGVQVRTQTEANRMALARLGQDAFDTWLELRVGVKTTPRA